MTLRTLSVADLRRELARRESGATQLQAQRDKLQRRLDAIMAELSDLGVDAAPARRGPGRPPKVTGRGPGRPRGASKAPRSKRARNELSLADAVAKVVAVGKTVSPAAVLADVRKIYKSTSKSLGMMVAGALARHPHFKKVGRGQYLRKAGGAATPATPATPAKVAKAAKIAKPARGKARAARKATRGKQRAARRAPPAKAKLASDKHTAARIAATAAAAAAAAGAAAAAAG